VLTVLAVDEVVLIVLAVLEVVDTVLAVLEVDELVVVVVVVVVAGGGPSAVPPSVATANQSRSTSEVPIPAPTQPPAVILLSVVS